MRSLSATDAMHHELQRSPHAVAVLVVGIWDSCADGKKRQPDYRFLSLLLHLRDLVAAGIDFQAAPGSA